MRYLAGKPHDNPGKSLAAFQAEHFDFSLAGASSVAR
jgi:hypothetical protein